MTAKPNWGHTTITLEEYRAAELDLTRPLTWGPMQLHTQAFQEKPEHGFDIQRLVKE